MSNDYFISFLNLCVKTLNDTRYKMERVIKNTARAREWSYVAFSFLEVVPNLCMRHI